MRFWEGNTLVPAVCGCGDRDVLALQACGRSWSGPTDRPGGQDEWYGLTIEDIRQLKKEAQLMLAQKMAQFCSENDPEQHGVKDTPGEKDVEPSTGSPADTEDASANSDAASGRSLTKQWSTSSKSSRSSKRGGKMLPMTCSSELMEVGLLGG